MLLMREVASAFEVVVEKANISEPSSWSTPPPDFEVSFSVLS
jgi:hypothetical protein